MFSFDMLKAIESEGGNMIIYLIFFAQEEDGLFFPNRGIT